MPAEASKSGKFLFAGRRDGAGGLTRGVASIGFEATCSARTHSGADLPADGKLQGSTASARTLKVESAVHYLDIEVDAIETRIRSRSELTRYSNKQTPPARTLAPPVIRCRESASV